MSGGTGELYVNGKSDFQKRLMAHFDQKFDEWFEYACDEFLRFSVREAVRKYFSEHQGRQLAQSIPSRISIAVEDACRVRVREIVDEGKLVNPKGVK